MGPVRRVFLERRELGALVVGALRGKDVALRRILGARGGGRYGLLFASLLALAAVPLADLPLAIAAHLLFTVITRAWLGQLDWKQQQRLVLWIAVPPLAVAALGRALGAPPLALALVAIALAHALLVRHLRRWTPAPD